MPKMHYFRLVCTDIPYVVLAICHTIPVDMNVCIIYELCMQVYYVHVCVMPKMPKMPKMPRMPKMCRPENSCGA